jgi:hypothetical protein
MFRTDFVTDQIALRNIVEGVEPFTSIREQVQFTGCITYDQDFVVGIPGNGCWIASTHSFHSGEALKAIV